MGKSSAVGTRFPKVEFSQAQTSRWNAVRSIEISRLHVDALRLAAKRLRRESFNRAVVTPATFRWPKKGPILASITKRQIFSVDGLKLCLA